VNRDTRDTPALVGTPVTLAIADTLETQGGLELQAL
jgi:hypothetical protein